jgi:RNA polymerase sigma-70 factor (ECF subfamily)
MAPIASAVTAGADSSAPPVTFVSGHPWEWERPRAVPPPVARSNRNSGVRPKDAIGNERHRSATASATDATFDDVVVPHLEAARRLARWLLRNEDDAEDAVQDACLRALRYFHTFAGGNGRAWFLRIVRHVCWSRRAHGFALQTDPFDEEQHSVRQPALDAVTRLIQIDDVALVGRALSTLPDRFRELMVLRELEGLSYRELADVIHVPMGTVMSGLSRARQAFRTALIDQQTQSAVVKGRRRQEQEANAVQQ